MLQDNVAIPLRWQYALEGAGTSEDISLQVGDHEEHSVVYANLLYEVHNVDWCASPRSATPRQWSRTQTLKKLLLRLENVLAIPSYLGVDLQIVVQTLEDPGFETFSDASYPKTPLVDVRTHVVSCSVQETDATVAALFASIQ